MKNDKNTQVITYTKNEIDKIIKDLNRLKELGLKIQSYEVCAFAQDILKLIKK